MLADDQFDPGGFEPVSDDMDGQARSTPTSSGSDHDSPLDIAVGVLTPLDVGPMNYTPPATPGTVVRFTVNNHDFDEGEAGWTFSGPAELTTVAGEVYSRGTSAKVAPSGRIAQTVPVQPGANYTLSAFTTGPIRMGVELGGVAQVETTDNSRYRFTQLSFDSGAQDQVVVFFEASNDPAFFDSVRLISHPAPGPP